MAAYEKFEVFVENLAEKVHDLGADSLKVALTNTNPNNSTNTILANITQISGTNGYTTGGIAITSITSVQTGGIYKLSTTFNPVWTATGSMGPFQHVVLYNDTPTSPVDPLIANWDYGSAITLNATETFTVDFDDSNGILQIQ